ncbi:MAG: hypothetical protein KDD70_01785, partial [Bdellovibrionales bacterium]|nr:hypothetical protein [Bdellovibrionales bacterium]
MDVLDGSPRKGRGEEAAQDCATERIERRSQTGKSTSRRVQWTDDEQALFVDHCARHQLEHPEADYLAVLRSGMKEMPEERQRKVIQVHPFEKYRDAIVEKVAELRARHEAPSTPAADTIDSRPERQEFDLPPEFTAETTRDEAAGHSPLSDALARALRDVIADAISQGTQQVEANVAERFQRIEESIERLQHRLDEIAE